MFQPWLRGWLLPTLPPGTTIVCDNLSVHRTPDVRTMVEAAGCQVRSLPPYSPDSNPIELALSTLKTHLRTVGARTSETLVPAIGAGIGQVTASEAQAWYRHGGYPFPTDDPMQPL